MLLCLFHLSCLLNEQKSQEIHIKRYIFLSLPFVECEVAVAIASSSSKIHYNNFQMMLVCLCLCIFRKSFLLYIHYVYY